MTKEDPEMESSFFHSGRRVVLGLALLAGGAIGWTINQPTAARADHTFSNLGVQGDCWAPGTPLQCARGYNLGGNYFYRVSKNWSGQSGLQARADPGIEAAKTNWTNAVGPQFFVSSSNPSTPNMNVYTYVYPNIQPSAPDFQAALQSGAIAAAKNFKLVNGSYQQCFNTAGGLANNACVVSFSEVYFNRNMDAACAAERPAQGGIAAAVWQNVYAHEFGHVQGLDEHPGGVVLMNNFWPEPAYPCEPWVYSNYGLNGVTATDLGTPVLAGATSCGSPRGIRCIFKWPN
jgi:hypothetical protein